MRQTIPCPLFKVFIKPKTRLKLSWYLLPTRPLQSNEIERKYVIVRTVIREAFTWNLGEKSIFMIKEGLSIFQRDWNNENFHLSLLVIRWFILIKQIHFMFCLLRNTGRFIYSYLYTAIIVRSLWTVSY